MRKYEKTLANHGGFKQCFNDVLGFRLRFDEYPNDFPDYFRVVDLRNGKQIDDGYRAIHLYYQRDSLAYPIEVQLWCGKDYHFNLWSHQYVYKYKSPEIGKKLYQEYTANILKTEQDFQKRLQELEEYDNGRKKYTSLQKSLISGAVLPTAARRPTRPAAYPEHWRH